MKSIYKDWYFRWSYLITIGLKLELKNRPFLSLKK